ncbi:hypothetical protein [Actinoplanes couchii]|uniref:Uncharacterized protein n=1 Tax=Actinoplanes couchii TaxID=403638 RepID=A0ABQ3XQZ9_9ACTN|nr:hypothetical protein [Actinoplanes couchii]MDR6317413.1 hypothetical protein [Actinoplanes couchii]GID60946.1 hypothetical protein Aco03nite_093500 [Actinoplanes couchii]
MVESQAAEARIRNQASRPPSDHWAGCDFTAMFAGGLALPLVPAAQRPPAGCDRYRGPTPLTRT